MTNLVDKQCKEKGWRTPDRILDPVRRYANATTGGGIWLDPATTRDNPVSSRHILTPDEDGLSISWLKKATHHVVFLNPPYGRDFPAWTVKVGEESRAGCHLVCLFAAQRFETAYYQAHVLQPALTAMCFVRKRLRFIGTDGKAYPGNPYGSVVLLYNGFASAFRREFEPEGTVIQPMF